MTTATAVKILETMIDTAVFRARFPNVRLLRTPAEIAEARKRLPQSLMPFMRDMNEWRQGCFTYYGIDLDDPNQNRVAVWSCDAIVFDWATLDDFIKWIHTPLPPRGDK